MPAHVASGITAHLHRNTQANLLDSLPGILSEEDEGVAEALRRDAEANVNPDATISLAQLDSQIQSRRN
jgi:hypothetical protein